MHSPPLSPLNRAIPKLVIGLLLLCLVLLLNACALVAVEEPPQATCPGVPATLIAPTRLPLLRGATNESLLILAEETRSALAACNADKDAIRKLQ